MRGTVATASPSRAEPEEVDREDHATGLPDKAADQLALVTQEQTECSIVGHPEERPIDPAQPGSHGRDIVLGG